MTNSLAKPVMKAALIAFALLLAAETHAGVYTSPPANAGPWGVYPNCIAPAIPLEIHGWWDEDATPSATDDAPRHLHMSGCFPNARDIGNTLVPKLSSPVHFIAVVTSFNNPSSVKLVSQDRFFDAANGPADTSSFTCTTSSPNVVMMAGRPQCTWYVDVTLDPSTAPYGISEYRLSPNVASHVGLGTRQFLTLNAQLPIAGKTGTYRHTVNPIARSWYSGLTYNNVDVNYMDFFNGAADLNKSVPVVKGIVPIKVRTQEQNASGKMAIWQDTNHHMDPKFWKTAKVGDIHPSGGKLLYLAAGPNKTVTFNWDTTGLADGRHTLYFQAQESDSRGVNASALKLFFDVCNHAPCSSTTAMAPADDTSNNLAENTLPVSAPTSLASTIVAGFKTFIQMLQNIF